MQQSSTRTALKPSTRTDHTPRAHGLLHDQRGLSTAEYTMVFVTVAIGALATWKALGNSLANQVTTSTSTFNSVLLQHAGDANKDKGDRHGDSVGVNILKQPGGHVEGSGPVVGKTDDRHMDAPAATGAYKDDQRGGQVQASSGQVYKGDQRADQMQAAQPANEVHKNDQQRADPMQAAQPANEVHKNDQQRADPMQAAQAAGEAPKTDQQHADAVPTPSEGLHKQDQDLVQPSDTPTNKDFQEKRDPEPHYSTGTNKEIQTKMDPADRTKGDSRAVSNSSNKPRTATAVKGGNR